MFDIIKINLKTGCATIPIQAKSKKEFSVVGNELKNKIKQLFGGRSLHVRQIDAGSCNGCELEISALSNPIYDIERFGIHFVASPRHADVLLVTGPITRQMEPALIKTYEATPEPRIVIATGDCAINCGVYVNSYAVSGPLNTIIPVDVNIPGCPPNPTAILQALLSILDRLPKK
ncbi:MAG: hydrogenase [Elusimicrobia bacterium RIFCSPLOWO2_02_FULL_39_32]|nr:MAG: hydrogenase [Elusimicrobia bacterium GWA2_38_7]OGR80109.1 MAG: hydrogenase [Elusimicrobia bacterium RIFCSPHIGHO2_02_FULL_39_36]OGR91096.1 MAG: hydrogenase [Elusimicrobia bacterium RIFCSPLOWO2_02_FULL_39_32]OGS00063.1 MAG: hydrogenase [Elusimicrobia bacterium RIFCSPLOWO2_12_FULL_39_28]